MSVSGASNSFSNSLSISDVNTEFLPLIYEIVRSIERDTHDTTPQKALNIREHADCNQKMQILHERLNECREQINKLPGIGCTKEEQLKKLESLRQQLTMKKDLLMKYKHNCNFDTTQKLI